MVLYSYDHEALALNHWGGFHRPACRVPTHICPTKMLGSLSGALLFRGLHLWLTHAFNRLVCKQNALNLAFALPLLGLEKFRETNNRHEYGMIFGSASAAATSLTIVALSAPFQFGSPGTSSQFKLYFPNLAAVPAGRVFGEERPLGQVC